MSGKGNGTIFGDNKLLLILLLCLSGHDNHHGNGIESILPLLLLCGNNGHDNGIEEILPILLLLMMNNGDHCDHNVQAV